MEESLEVEELFKNVSDAKKEIASVELRYGLVQLMDKYSYSGVDLLIKNCKRVEKYILGEDNVTVL